MVIITYILFSILPLLTIPFVSGLFLFPTGLIIRKLPIGQNYKHFIGFMVGDGLGMFLLLYLLLLFSNFVLNVEGHIGMFIAPAIIILWNGIYRIKSRPEIYIELGMLIGEEMGLVLAWLLLV